MKQKFSDMIKSSDLLHILVMRYLNTQCTIRNQYGCSLQRNGVSKHLLSDKMKIFIWYRILVKNTPLITNLHLRFSLHHGILCIFTFKVSCFTPYGGLPTIVRHKQETRFPVLFKDKKHVCPSSNNISRKKGHCLLFIVYYTFSLPCLSGRKMLGNSVSWFVCIS